MGLAEVELDRRFAVDAQHAAGPSGALGWQAGGQVEHDAAHNVAGAGGKQHGVLRRGGEPHALGRGGGAGDAGAPERVGGGGRRCGLRGQVGQVVGIAAPVGEDAKACKRDPSCRLTRAGAASAAAAGLASRTAATDAAGTGTAGPSGLSAGASMSSWESAAASGR